MKKTVLCLVLFLVAMLYIAYVAYPIKATVDFNLPVIVQTVQSLTINGYEVSASRIDSYYASGAHNVSFEISMDSLPTFSSRFGRCGGSIYELTTDPIPYNQLLTLLNTDSSNSTSLDGPPPPPDPSLPQYQWNGITFVQAGTYEYQGASLWIKYDHPDNYEVYHLNPNGSPDVNDEYVIKGTNGVKAFHADKSDISSWSLSGGIVTAGSTLGAVLVGVALGANVLGALLIAFLTIVGVTSSLFVQNVIATELGDGWVYLGGFGRWNCWFLHSVWFKLSFGSWWNTWFYFFISNFAGCYIVPT